MYRVNNRMIDLPKRIDEHKKSIARMEETLQLIASGQRAPTNGEGEKIRRTLFTRKRTLASMEEIVKRHQATEAERNKPLEAAPVKMCPVTDAEICAWVRQDRPDYTDAECLEAWRIYRGYRDEGQTQAVSRQYAGLC